MLATASYGCLHSPTFWRVMAHGCSVLQPAVSSGQLIVRPFSRTCFSAPAFTYMSMGGPLRAPRPEIRQASAVQARRLCVLHIVANNVKRLRRSRLPLNPPLPLEVPIPRVDRVIGSNLPKSVALERCGRSAESETWKSRTMHIAQARKRNHRLVGNSPPK